MDGIFILLLIILIFFVLFSYNSIISMKNKVAQTKSSIDVYLNQRFDLIPNLVECVKGYMNYEKEIIEEITKLRASYKETKDLKEASVLNSKFNSILATAENYPDLKSSENFLSLQKSLEKIESQLQAARRLYNSEVTRYNTKLNTIPTNIIAKLFNFKEAELFQLEEYKKENININL